MAQIHAGHNHTASQGATAGNGRSGATRGRSDQAQTLRLGLDGGAGGSGGGLGGLGGMLGGMGGASGGMGGLDSMLGGMGGKGGAGGGMGGLGDMLGGMGGMGGMGGGDEDCDMGGLGDMLGGMGGMGKVGMGKGGMGKGGGMGGMGRMDSMFGGKGAMGKGGLGGMANMGETIATGFQNIIQSIFAKVGMSGMGGMGGGEGCPDEGMMAPGKEAAPGKNETQVVSVNGTEQAAPPVPAGAPAPAGAAAGASAGTEATAPPAPTAGGAAAPTPPAATVAAEPVAKAIVQQAAAQTGGSDIAQQVFDQMLKGGAPINIVADGPFAKEYGNRTAGVYDPNVKQITIPERMLADPAKLRLVLLHEGVHWLQDNVPGGAANLGGAIGQALQGAGAVRQIPTNQVAAAQHDEAQAYLLESLSAKQLGVSDNGLGTAANGTTKSYDQILATVQATPEYA